LYEQEVQKRNDRVPGAGRHQVGYRLGSPDYAPTVLDASRIKDLRTNIERSDCDKVLDGDIDEYLVASLKQGL